MPYIKKDRRFALNPVVMAASGSGELNYQFTEIIKRYLMKQYSEKGSLTYQTINDIVGALEGAKLEFYRRVVVSYEDQKIIENGDVY